MRKKSTPEEEQDEETGAHEEEELSSPTPTAGWKMKLATQLPFLAKILKISSDSASADSTSSHIKVPPAAGGDEKKKKIVRLILGLGLAYMVVDTFIPSDEPTEEVLPETATAPVAKRPKKRRPPKVDGGPATTAETPAATTVEAGVAKPVEDSSVATTPAQSTGDPATEPRQEGTPVTDAVVEESTSSVETEASAPVEAVAGESKDSETEADEKLNATDLGLEPQPGGEASTTDQVADGVKSASEAATEGDMTEQILQDLEKQMSTDAPKEPVSDSYIEPPDYENLGRGLVYNCLGKHWACVDGASYRLCQQNYLSLKGQGKPKECYVENVYQSNTDCASMQKQKITGNVKTDFCF